MPITMISRVAWVYALPFQLLRSLLHAGWTLLRFSGRVLASLALDSAGQLLHLSTWICKRLSIVGEVLLIPVMGVWTAWPVLLVWLHFAEQSTWLMYLPAGALACASLLWGRAIVARAWKGHPYLPVVAWHTPQKAKDGDGKGHMPARPFPGAMKKATKWKCPHCTLINESSAPRCQACDNVRLK